METGRLWDGVNKPRTIQKPGDKKIAIRDCYTLPESNPPSLPNRHLMSFNNHHADIKIRNYLRIGLMATEERN